MISMRALAIVIVFGVISPGAIERLAAQERGIVTPPPGQVAIYRDVWGMAHLYAAREEDGYWGLGYSTGEDRLEPVLLSYLAVKGELAAHFGRGPIKASRALPSANAVLVEDPVASDLKMMRDGYLDDARSRFSQLSPQLQRNLRAYIQGLRQFMTEHPQEVPAWAPTLEAALPVALYTATATPIDDDVCLARLPKATKRSSLRMAPGNVPLAPAMTASNAWMVAPERTQDHALIFAADSHGDIASIGTVFYPWRMKAGRLDVFAVDLTGTASLVKGHTRHYAWAWTEGPRFTADCYATRLGGNAADTYMVGHETYRLVRKPYRLAVRDEASITGTFEFTNHNAVLSPVVHRDGTTVYSVSFAYAGRAGAAHDAYLQMSRATSFRKLQSALATTEMYPANLLIGGADGTLMYIRPGRIPIRAPGANYRGVLDGNSADTRWLGIYSYGDLPKLQNPPQGYLSNSNVSPDMMFSEPVLRPEDFPDSFAFEPGRTNTRQARSLQLLSPTRELTIPGAIEMLFDTRIPGFERWGEVLREGLADLQPPDGAHAAEFDRFKQALARFDGFFPSDSRPALYIALLLEQLELSAGHAQESAIAAVESGATLSAEQRRQITLAAQAAFVDLVRSCGSIDRSFGDVFRTGRGAVSEPSGGISFPARRASLRAANYRRIPGACVREQYGGMRIPFLIAFTRPMQSLSLNLYGNSDKSWSAHFSDQAVLSGRQQLKPNYFEPQELAHHIESFSIKRTSTAPLRRDAGHPP